MKEKNLSEWLKAKCDEEGLSLRQVATRVGVSHQTIAALMNSREALPQTIKKLAKAFGDDHCQRLALEDKLLILTGYRTERPKEELNEALGRLMDKLKPLNEPQIEMVGHFVDYFIGIDWGRQ